MKRFTVCLLTAVALSVFPGCLSIGGDDDDVEETVTTTTYTPTTTRVTTVRTDD